eukprot:TRINITY_DN10398_c0_g1_i1.p2 TRINITY_DN10398_c0_g1~~TRINITY_DN10398_c0_g1_i1.p2  ORF type:complete len:113 (-),score=5.20 TRINITY_DN10398_c0_g1_i1:193-531(-)
MCIRDSPLPLSNDRYRHVRMHDQICRDTAEKAAGNAPFRSPAHNDLIRFFVACDGVQCVRDISMPDHAACVHARLFQAVDRRGDNPFHRQGDFFFAPLMTLGVFFRCLKGEG